MSRTKPDFEIGQRVHSIGDTRRIGTVKYVGFVEGYSGFWVGVDWDNGDGKHDGSVNGVQYFQASMDNSASFIKPQNLSSGITMLEALMIRYRGESTKEEEDEMYVLSASNKKVSIELVGKEKIENKFSHFDELSNASLAYLGVSSAGTPGISSIAPNLKELDLTGNLLSDWKDIAAVCQELPSLSALNLSNNMMSEDVTCLPILRNIRVLVLNYTGVKWTQVGLLNDFLPSLEELHLMGNKISEITTTSKFVQGFDSLRILNLEDNCISEWGEVSKLSELISLEQLHLSKNHIRQLFYPCTESMHNSVSHEAFQNLHCLLLGANNIMDLKSIDSLNSFPSLIEVRLSDNPIADTARGGIPRFVLIARLAKVKALNGSEVSNRERKESEIRYVRLVMSKLYDDEEEIKQSHPRFYELKILCETFFKLKSMKLKLFLQEEVLPLLLMQNGKLLRSVKSHNVAVVCLNWVEDDGHGQNIHSLSLPLSSNQVAYQIIHASINKVALSKDFCRLIVVCSGELVSSSCEVNHEPLSRPETEGMHCLVLDTSVFRKRKQELHQVAQQVSSID